VQDSGVHTYVHTEGWQHLLWTLSIHRRPGCDGRHRVTINLPSTETSSPPKEQGREEEASAGCLADQSPPGHDMIPQHMATHLLYATVAWSAAPPSEDGQAPAQEAYDVRTHTEGRTANLDTCLSVTMASFRPDTAPCLSPSVGLSKPYLPDHQRWLEWAFCELGLMY